MKLLYVELAFSKETSEALLKLAHKTLKESTEYNPSHYPLQKKETHVTLCYHSDFPNNDDFMDFSKNYVDSADCECSLEYLVVDKHCVAFGVHLSGDTKFYPSDKNLHITMMLNGKPPVYSNELIKNLKSGSGTGSIVTLDKESLKLTGKIHFVYSRK
jgi:hypothetical protein